MRRAVSRNRGRLSPRTNLFVSCLPTRREDTLMADKPGTLLTAIADFPAPVASRLGELWLTTAEEFASASSQPGGSSSLATFLRLPSSEIERLINVVSAVVPGGVSFAEDAVPVSFGALSVENVASPDDEPRSFAPLPSRIDLHEQMPAVRSQGGRGTCVAHATSAVREFLLGEQSRR